MFRLSFQTVQLQILLDSHNSETFQKLDSLNNKNEL